MHLSSMSGVQALGQLFKDGQVYLPEILIPTRAMNEELAEDEQRFFILEPLSGVACQETGLR